jgi:hypothetical protein
MAVSWQDWPSAGGGSSAQYSSMAQEEVAPVMSWGRVWAVSWTLVAGVAIPLKRLANR